MGSSKLFTHSDFHSEPSYRLPPVCPRNSCFTERRDSLFDCVWSGIQEDEILAEVIGYLEACRDRIADLIEAGTQGLLGEELLALCLRANDAVLRTLDAEKVSVFTLGNKHIR